jgi:membrane fusion protein (multidrug efflux system)
MRRLLVIGMLGATVLSGCDKQSAPPQMPPPMVGVLIVREQPVVLSTELPGRTDPYAVSNVEPQVTGIIKARLFVEGSVVQAGQSLYQIDPRPYEAARDQAEGQLQQAQANLLDARLDLKRYQTLLAQNAISHQTLDTQVALVSSDEGIVKSDQANVETAQINLGYTKVTAPITGRIGASSVTVGALVTANQTTPIATIQTLDPIYVDINQSSTELLALEHQMQSGVVDRNAPLSASVTLILEDGSAYPSKGKLQFTDVTVNQTTGSVLLRALFPNPGGLLLPGLFVRAVVDQGVDPHGILIPQQAIGHNAKGEPTALVVDDKNIARLRILKTGRALDNNWQVLDGLKAGDKVIVEGLAKVLPDIPVTPQPVSQAPAATKAP